MKFWDKFNIDSHKINTGNFFYKTLFQDKTPSVINQDEPQLL
ncbi:hypothetical protein G436_4441 [Leptospira interrogans serovar Hardjo str. Norma]|uniref:Uncharacterized protein n=1 Tax=Leptospira interrogans serovar Hardjo str. Norma TaxID=1279460 RepID=A0A0M5LC71_LEPIR|nr:hypothetical protein G436_4441 [Leptospira interrogans serovar Hardjo str. Norma]